MTSTLDMSRADWLAIRRSGLGGSDAAAAIGVSPYRSPFEVYSEKRGEREPDDLSDNARVQWGIRLEAVIADAYAEQTGRRVRRINRVLRHATHAHMLGNIDRDVVGEPRGLECKNVGYESAHFSEDAWGPTGSDKVPMPYFIQAQHYMAIKPDWKIVDLAALIAGNELRIYPIERDEVTIAALLKLEAAFWHNVQQGVPPSAHTMKEAQERWKAAARPIEANVDIVAEVNALRELSAAKSANKARIDAVQVKIANYMQEHDTLTVAGVSILTFKEQTRAAHAVKESTFRVMRAKGAKE